LAREHPHKFFACLALMDAAEGQKKEVARRSGEGAHREPQDGSHVPGAEGEGPRGRVKKLRVTEAQVAAYLTGRKYPWVKNLPPAFEIVACEWEPGQKVFVLTLRSEAFPLVPEGQDVPELEVDFAYPER
jgi:hypothetical protein